MKVKEESEKVGLKLNIQKTKIMASGPIPSWEIDGETVETVLDFNFGGSKITAPMVQMVTAAMKLKDAYSLEEKLWPTKIAYLKAETLLCRLVKAMVFPVVMYGCESWTVKKAERQKLMLLNCDVGEDYWESLGLQGDPNSPS